MKRISSKLDFIINNATIYDGSGQPPFKANIGILKNRIQILNPQTNYAGNNIIDANGLILTPGFIDVHGHDDLAVFTNPSLDYKIMQGITTAIVGNCGYSAFPYSAIKKTFLFPKGKFNIHSWKSCKEYFSLLSDFPPSINISLLMGHNTLRMHIMDNLQRPANKSEILKMQHLIEKGINEGIMGFSSGLAYEQGFNSNFSEIKELVKILTNKNLIYTTHIRDEGNKLIPSIEEAISISELTNVPVHISHLKNTDKKDKKKIKKTLKLIDKANISGLKISNDVYPYNSGSTVLSAVLKICYLKRKVCALPDILICSSKYFPEFIGKDVNELCRSLKITPTNIIGNHKFNDIIVITRNLMNYSEVEQIIKHNTTMFGTDADTRAKGNCHPRTYGTFPRIIQKYVRENNLLSLEEAIYKMTFLPSKTFHLEKRGCIKDGFFADIVLFDFNKISDLASDAFPRKYPSGIKYVFVNGELAVNNGQLAEMRAGQPITNKP